ncbi:MAG: hypothetical protein GY940_19490 [bacterium]|nr:hypothetical protein [bacterium]
MKKYCTQCLILLLLLPCCLMPSGEEDRFYLRGAFYQDWMGFKTGDSDMYNRVSSRLKLSFWEKAGTGWTAFVDIRNRLTLGEGGKNQLIIYDARLSYDKQGSKLFFSLGQMNLYDTAGIGQLTGGLAGYKFGKYFSAGGYGGFEPDIYNSRWDTNYTKFGFFIRYIGTRARRLAVSYNRVRFEGKPERQFIFASTLLPVQGLMVLYGNMEYETGPSVGSEDRLARLFLNARINLGRFADVTCNYSSGRGLDYHRFLLEQSQSPTIQNSEIERYYYNESYGVRLSVKPVKHLRIYAARRESKHNDKGVRNHTNRFGLSASDIFHSGLSIYGNYSMKRGDMSESDSYYISTSRSFGKLSWSVSFANYYNGVRFVGTGMPEVFHLPGQKTISTNLFLVLNRALAFSFEYAYTDQAENTGEHQLFLRAIYRKRK